MSRISTPAPEFVVREVAKLPHFRDAWDVAWSFEPIERGRGTQLLFRNEYGDRLIVRVARCRCCKSIIWDFDIEEASA